MGGPLVLQQRGTLFLGSACQCVSGCVGAWTVSDDSNRGASGAFAELPVSFALLATAQSRRECPKRPVSVSCVGGTRDVFKDIFQITSSSSGPWVDSKGRKRTRSSSLARTWPLSQSGRSQRCPDVGRATSQWNCQGCSPHRSRVALDGWAGSLDASI